MDPAPDQELTSALLPGILMNWSPTDIDTAVKSSLVQFYPILLSTLFSVNRQQLSLFDASYALVLSSSPLTVYLVISSISAIFGVKNSLNEGIRFYPRTTFVIGALILPIWLGLSLTVWLSRWAFIDSELCKDSTFKDWLTNLLPTLLLSVLGSSGYPVVSAIVISLFFICLVRRRRQVVADVLARSEGVHGPWRWWRLLWTSLWRAWYDFVVALVRLVGSNPTKVCRRLQP